MNSSLYKQQQQFTQALADQDAQLSLTHPQHLGIYRQNIALNLTSALREIYPITLQLVGAGFFKTAAYFYQQQYPSQSGDLNNFGDQFANFIAAYAPAQSLAYLSEVAALEWACHQVFYAADSTTLNIAALAQIPEDRLCFALQPACRLLKCQYPILQIWQFCQSDTEATLDLTADGVSLLVWRQGFEVQLQALSPGEFAFLTALQQPATLGSAFEAALAIEPELDITSTAQQFIRQKNISLNQLF